jgi:hypothetical protein
MFTVAFLLAPAPFALLLDLVRLLARWRRVPLKTRNQIRAGLGAALLTFAAIFCWDAPR